MSCPASSLLCLIVLLLVSTTSTEAQKLLPRRDVFVRFGGPAGGDGSREKPYASLQEMVDRHDAEWGQVFLHPGVYRENVDIHRGRFWFFPAQQYGVVIEGTITIRRPGTIIRGLDFRSQGSCIVLAEGAKDCQIQHNRFRQIGRDSAGVDVVADDVSGCLINDNVADLRDGEGEGRTGLRMRVGPGVTHNRLDHNQIAGCDVGIAMLPEGEASGQQNVLSGNRLLGNRVGVEVRAGGVTVRGNAFERNREAGIAATGEGAVLYGNRMTGDGTGIAIGGGQGQVANNVISGCIAGALRVDAGQAEVLHNTLHAPAGQKPLVEIAAGAQAALRCNILSSPGELLRSGGQVDLAANLYSHEAAEAAGDPHGITGDPRFVNPQGGDFHLQPDSPAAHRLAAPELTGDIENIGRPWGEKASLGAHELAGQRAARTIYVGGKTDGADGSRQKPYGDVGSALTVAAPGDEIVVLPGEHDFGHVSISRSGAPLALITVRSETPYAARLGHTSFVLENCSYVRLQGFEFTDPAGRSFTFGAYSSHCEVVGNRIVRTTEGAGGIGISGPAATHHLIADNTLALIKGPVGIQINCQRHNWHHTIRGNDLSGCYYAIQTGGGSYPTAPPGYYLIEDNYIHDNVVDGIHTKTTDNVIRHNLICDNGNYGITTRYGARNVIVGNTIRGNGHGVRLHSPSHFVINNVICNNRGRGLYASSWPGSKEGEFPFNFEPYYEPPREVWIAHNTIVGNGDAPVMADNGAWLMLLRNIIVGSDADKPGVVFTAGGVARQVDQNLYWQARPPLLREYEGGSEDRVADPCFVDAAHGDYRLQENSPARVMPPLGDALAAVLSHQPCGIPLPDHLGANLPPRAAGKRPTTSSDTR